MNKKKKEFFRQYLNKMLEELESGVKETVNIMALDEETFPDPNDRASLESDRNRDLRIRDRERKLVPKIRKALQRIEDSTYDVCEECGETISEQRLKARPVTTLCIKCKEEQEKQEKIR